MHVAPGSPACCVAGGDRRPDPFDCSGSQLSVNSAAPSLTRCRYVGASASLFPGFRVRT
jgi:hypothetical protein